MIARIQTDRLVGRPPRGWTVVEQLLEVVPDTRWIIVGGATPIWDAWLEDWGREWVNEWGNVCVGATYRFTAWHHGPDKLWEVVSPPHSFMLSRVEARWDRETLEHSWSVVFSQDWESIRLKLLRHAS